MIGCDFLGLENLIHNKRIQTSDIGYLYAIISILINNQKVITFDGRTDISNLKIIFKVSDRTNVLRILDRLTKTMLVKYSLSKIYGDNSVFISIDERCTEYFFQK